MSKGHYLLDKIKFNRWLNIRKTTIDQLNKDLKYKLNFEISFDNCENLDDYSIKIISDIGIGNSFWSNCSLNTSKNPLTKAVPPPITIGTGSGKLGTFSTPSNWTFKFVNK